LKVFRESAAAGVVFQLIFMDYQMPSMDGPTTIKVLREDGFAGTIVGVTGNVVAEDKLTMMSAGADVVMEKPFDVDRFSDWYSSHLQQRASSAVGSELDVSRALLLKFKPGASSSTWIGASPSSSAKLAVV